jgi:hypothetical protein
VSARWRDTRARGASHRGSANILKYAKADITASYAIFIGAMLKEDPRKRLHQTRRVKSACRLLAGIGDAEALRGSR